MEVLADEIITNGQKNVTFTVEGKEDCWATFLSTKVLPLVLF